MTRSGITLLLAAFAWTAVAQELPYEKVLFPVLMESASPLPGANGSLWMTDSAVLNRSDEPVKLYGAYICLMCRTAQPLVPGVTYEAVVHDNPTGTFILLERGKSDRIAFELRVRNVAGDEAGTALPVVREREFSSTGVSLLNVPLGGEQRLLLRVYALHHQPAATVLVRTYAQNVVVPSPTRLTPDELLGESVHALVPYVTSGFDPEQFPTFVNLSTLPLGDAAPNRVRIDVLPLSPADMKIWAFVTLTHNRTQAVTVIAPQ
jgi:hypothetical protein